MDIPFELLFVLFFLLASVLDAVGRSRKKRERIEEMEREEQADAEGPVTIARGGTGQVPSGTRAPSKPRAPVEPRAPSRTRAPSPERASPRTMEPYRTKAETPPRETADSMIPSELWEILTGVPAPSRPRGPVEFPEHTSQDAESLETDTLETVSLESEPVGRESLETEPVLREPRERVARFGIPDPAGSRPRHSEALARGLPTEGGRLVASASVPRVASHARRPSPYIELLRSPDRANLRSAIVLAEVFGSPLALRDSSSATSPRAPSS
jgi:hypothetical protein